MLGIKVITNDALIVHKIDASKIRSMSRAMRRFKRKHRPRLYKHTYSALPDPNIYKFNGMLVCHPAIHKALLATLET